MKKILALLVTGIGSIFFSFSQHPQLMEDSTAILNEAKKDVEFLCSAELAGRGYVEEGHKKAARYLAQRYREIGLEGLNEGSKNPYFQPFDLEINLATQLDISINGQRLEAGLDAIVNKFSGSGKVKGKLVDMGYGLKPSSKAEGKIVLIRSGWPSKLDSREKRKPYAELSKMVDRIASMVKEGATGIVIIQEKLTAGFTRKSAPIPVVEVKKSSLPKRVKKVEMEVLSQMSLINSQNVIGVIPGTNTPEQALIVSAHYDHLGKLEEAIFTGANDNASGTSMLLSLATYFKAHPLDKSLIFIAFGGEETGLVGSNFYANQQPLFPLDSTRFILNLDLMANGIDGITAVGGKDYPEKFELLKALNEERDAVPVVRARPNAPNSDHFFFLKRGVPGFFIYTLGGPPHYHDVNDRPENLEYSRYVNVRNLLIRFLEKL